MNKWIGGEQRDFVLLVLKFKDNRSYIHNDDFNLSMHIIFSDIVCVSSYTPVP